MTLVDILVVLRVEFALQMANLILDTASFPLRKISLILVLTNLGTGLVVLALRGIGSLNQFQLLGNLLQLCTEPRFFRTLSKHLDVVHQILFVALLVVEFLPQGVELRSHFLQGTLLLGYFRLVTGKVIIQTLERLGLVRFQVLRDLTIEVIKPLSSLGKVVEIVVETVFFMLVALSQALEICLFVFDLLFERLTLLFELLSFFTGHGH
mmetsp:Transcript_37164/g.80905  ORF Transcript_37164/g.80905 Transcript_37164/m.80905 type:complete len:209 (+) Transcript_37164:694-1320(+)